MSRSEAAALLDVPVGAGAPEVQHAYLRAARRTHPDALPHADEAARRAASEAFDRLTQARDVLVAPAPPPPAGPPPTWIVQERRSRLRELSGSLVVLALLAFVLMALVELQQAVRSPDLEGPAPSVSVSPAR